jgi:integrase
MGRMKKPRYVHFKKDRRGGGYWYFDRPGYPRVRLPGLPWSPQFMGAYESALGTDPLPIGAKSTAAGSMADLIVKYYGSATFKALEPSTQQVYRRIIERIRECHGAKPVKLIEPRHVRKLASEISAPAAARRFLSILRILLEHGVTCGMLDSNPAALVKGPKVKGKGFHSWTDAEIVSFEEAHPIGSKPRLALALLLYLGQRKSDVVKLGRQHRDGDVFRIAQKKTGAELEIPIHPALDEVLKATPSGHLAYLVTAFKKPYTANGFGNAFREWCDAAGLPHCTSHGLRKATARRLAEAGASPHEIASITGHESLREVERYTRAANRKKLAESAQAKVIAAFPGTKGERNT